jgi:AcrR family transcriptional regulator
MSSSPIPQEPRWRRLPEERPKQIIEAALEVFAERGLSQARLDDIAKRAGVSKGTIYLYFPNKEELFREVVRSTVVARLERAEQVVALAEGSSREVLTQVLQTMWEFLHTPTFAAIFRLVTAELNDFPDLAAFYAQEVIKRGQRLISGVVARGMDAGEFRRTDPSVAARILTSTFLVHGLWCTHRQLCTHIAGRSDEQVFAELTDFALTALTPRPDAA